MYFWRSIKKWQSTYNRFLYCGKALGYCTLFASLGLSLSKTEDFKALTYELVKIIFFPLYSLYNGHHFLLLFCDIEQKISLKHIQKTFESKHLNLQVFELIRIFILFIHNLFLTKTDTFEFETHDFQ